MDNRQQHYPHNPPQNQSIYRQYNVYEPSTEPRVYYPKREFRQSGNYTESKPMNNPPMRSTISKSPSISSQRFVAREHFPVNQPQKNEANATDRILKQSEVKNEDKDYKIAELERTNMELKKTIYGIKDSGNESDKVKSLMGQISELTKEVISLKEENERLRSLANDELMMVEKVETKEIFGKKSKVMSQIEEGKKAQDEVSALRRQLDQAEKRYSTLFSEHEALKKKPMVINNYEIHKKEIVQKEHIIETKERELRIEREKTNNYYNTIEQLKRQLEQTQRPPVRIISDPEKDKEINNLRQMLRDKDGLLSAKANDLRMAEERIRNLQATIDSLNSEFGKLRQEKPLEVAHLRKEIENKNSMIANLNSQKQANSQQYEHQIRDLQYQLDAERNRVRGTSDQHLRQIFELNNIKKQQEATIKQLNELLDQYRLKMTTQMNDLDNLKKQSESNYDIDQRNSELSILLKTKDGLLKQKTDEHEILKRNLDFYKNSLDKKTEVLNSTELENRRLKSLLKSKTAKESLNGIAKRIAEFIPVTKEFTTQTEKSEGVQIDLKPLKRKDQGVNVNFKANFDFTILNKKGAPNEKEAALQAELSHIKAKAESLETELNNIKNQRETETKEFRDKAYTFAQEKTVKEEDYNKLQRQYEELNARISKINDELMEISLNAPIEPQTLSELLKENKHQGLEVIKGVIKKLRTEANSKQQISNPNFSKKPGSRSNLPSDNNLNDSDEENYKHKYHEYYDMNQKLSQKIINQYDLIDDLENQINQLKQQNESNVNIIKKNTEKMERIDQLKQPSFNIDNISMKSTGHEVNYKEEIERLKKENQEWKEKYDKLREDIVSKKRGLLKELASFVNSKNSFENNFLTELNQA